MGTTYVPCGGHTGVQYPVFVSLGQRLAIVCACYTNSVDKMAVEDCNNRIWRLHTVC